MNLQNYSFTLAIASHSDFDDDLADRVYECGCDDGSLRVMDGELCLDIDREAPNIMEAITTAVDQLNRADIYIDRVIFENKALYKQMRQALYNFSFLVNRKLNKTLALKLLSSSSVSDFIAQDSDKTLIVYNINDVTEDNAFFKATKEVCELTNCSISFSMESNYVG